MFADYRGFDSRYFEDGFQGSYVNYPPGRIDYSAFGETVADVTGQSKVLVAGCGTGLTIHWMRQHIDRVFGVDISDWAMENVDNRIRDYVYQGDVRDPDMYGDIAQDAQGPPRWDGIYSEFLLSHFTDETAKDVYDLIRQNADEIVVHRIWSGTGHEWEKDMFNLKTIAEWRQLVGDHADVEWIDYDGGSTI